MTKENSLLDGLNMASFLQFGPTHILVNSRKQEMITEAVSDHWAGGVPEKHSRIYIPRHGVNTTAIIYYLLTGNNIGEKE